MRTARILLASCALVMAACSSGEDDSSVPVTDVEATDPATEPTATDVTSASTEPAAPSETQDTGPVDTTPVDESTDTTDAADSGQDGTDLEDSLVIDGPAEVRPSCVPPARGVTDFTLDAGGGVHDVRIYVPQTLSSDPAPTVLNWHGLGSSGPQHATFTGYEALAEEQGFIVVHPTGLNGGTGANSWELTQFDTDERDDLAFADALIDTMVDDWCGDPARIYSTGMSNGGLFTSELVCNRSDRIAAAASIAGTTHAPSCDPERPVPYVAFHGTADNVVPFAADDPSVLLPQAGIDALIDDTTRGEFAEFAADAGCDPEPTRVDVTDEVIRYDYAGCDDDVPMAFYEIVGGGHTWPSSPLSESLAGFGYFTQDIDATADAWAFMSQFSL